MSWMVRGLQHARDEWGPKKLRARLKRNGSCPDGRVPSLATVARLARRMGWTEAKGRGRPRVPRAQPAGPLSAAERPNRVWTADFKGWWRTGDGRRCEPLTIRDLFSRYILCLRPMAWCSTRKQSNRLSLRPSSVTACRISSGVTTAVRLPASPVQQG
jgi:transposase InsO family protein